MKKILGHLDLFEIIIEFVSKHGSPEGLTNSFQIVITSNANASYTIYNYGQLSWYEKISYALYNAGDGIIYLILHGSLSSDILELSRLSNIGRPGKWIFDV
jgi:hypothetical protein